MPKPTKDKKGDKPKRVRNFCMTVNNYTDDMIKALQELEIIKYGLMGKEVGKKNKTPHLQGYVQLKKAQSIKAFQDKLKKVGVKAAIFIARAGYKKNYNYCSKDGNVIEWGEAKKQGERTDIQEMYADIKAGMPLVDLMEKHPDAYVKYYKAVDRIRQEYQLLAGKEYLKETFKKVKLKLWQRVVVQKLERQNSRQITWIYNQDGNIGKTFLAKFLMAKKNAFYIGNAKSADIAYAFNHEEYVIFDFNRSNNEEINYEIIENFKNGLLFSPKYASQMKVFKPCKVLCFSNFHPRTSALSEDRWDIMEIETDDVNA